MKVRTEEVDKVSVNIAQNLLSNGFSFSVEQFLKIHENLFNESVKYADYKEIKDLLFYDFSKEKEFRNSLVRANYTNLDKGIYETTEYLEQFLRNILLNENNAMNNKDLKV